MSARQSAETARAIHLHMHEGKTKSEACKATGIFRSTLHRALKRIEKKKKKKIS